MKKVRANYIWRMLTIIQFRIFCLPVSSLVLYGHETWSLTPREEQKLRVFENWVLKRICGSVKEKETGGWRKVHNEELHNLNFSSNITRLEDVMTGCEIDEKGKQNFGWKN
jgi:hypothetical protein